MKHQQEIVRNPFAGLDDYQCFGCDPHNPIGLKLQFTRTGDAVSTVWAPRADLEGYPGVVHGGIQATLADELGAWYVYAILGTAGVTKSLTMEYKQPAFTHEGPFTIRGTGERNGRREARIHVSIENVSGEICALGECLYAVFSEEIARKKFFFPGKEAFQHPGS
jgi:uncharacterized protein (TIGR00369 family)